MGNSESVESTIVGIEKTLADEEKTFGPERPDVAFMLERLADLYRVTNNEKDVANFEKRAKAIRAIK